MERPVHGCSGGTHVVDENGGGGRIAFEDKDSFRVPLAAVPIQTFLFVAATMAKRRAAAPEGACDDLHLIEATVVSPSRTGGDRAGRDTVFRQMAPEGLDYPLQGAASAAELHRFDEVPGHSAVIGQSDPGDRASCRCDVPWRHLVPEILEASVTDSFRPSLHETAAQSA